MTVRQILRFTAFVSFVSFFLANTAAAQQATVRVVDVGGGLCTITEIPGGYYMLYDAGHWNGSNCHDAVREIVGDEDLDLVIISHSDSDHLGELDDILDSNHAKRIIRTGFRRTSKTWQKVNVAIADAAKDGASILNLQTHELEPGYSFQFGDAKVTLVAGWDRWTGGGLSESEERNAISIVARLEYAGHSVLFTGDTIGRTSNDPEDFCGHAEQIMVQNISNVPIDSDVLIGQHHGAENASAECFIQAVSPEFVIFSAGHVHKHPRKTTAERYQRLGIDPNNIFRTDRGDDEGGDEWDHGRINNCRDKSGDDDIEIILPQGGQVQVAYIEPQTGC